MPKLDQARAIQRHTAVSGVTTHIVLGNFMSLLSRMSEACFDLKHFAFLLFLVLSRNSSIQTSGLRSQCKLLFRGFESVQERPFQQETHFGGRVWSNRAAGPANGRRMMVAQDGSTIVSRIAGNDLAARV